MASSSEIRTDEELSLPKKYAKTSDTEEDYFFEGDDDDNYDPMESSESFEPLEDLGDEVDPELLKKPFEFVSTDDVLREINEKIDDTISLTNLSRGNATLLLKYFNWNTETIADTYFSNMQEHNRGAEIDILPVESTTSIKTDPFECLVCLEMTPIENSFSLACNHTYCLDCWKGYLQEQIKSSASRSIATRCISPKCLQVVPQELFKKLLSPDEYKKYLYFFLKSCVEESSKYTFCPRDCGTVVKHVDYGKPTECVLCPVCVQTFCFSCGQEKHNPILCSELKAWLQKEAAEEEAVKLIEATAKQCPHCNNYITRSTGCNHMTCRCGKEWCWMCRQDWKPHGSSWFDCFQYAQSEAKKKDDDTETHRKELERYTNYYNRFQDHRRTGIDAERKRSVMITKSQLFKQKTNFEAEFIIEALDVLINCRHTLKYFYVHRYYHEKEALSDLVIEQQKLAEHFTELLADLLFNNNDEFDRDKLKNHLRVTQKYLKGLVEAVEERV